MSLLWLAIVAWQGTIPAVPLQYQFEEVKGKALRIREEKATRVAAGDTALAGDHVRTGFLSRATISCPPARFTLYSFTRAQLAGDAPGVLLTLRKGKLEAWFDALRGDEQALVKAPGAILAVRGTAYGLEVDANGAAVLVVFSGIVEVRPLDERFPITPVRAGELCRFGPRSAPMRSPMPPGMGPEDWRHRGTKGLMPAMPRMPGGQHQPAAPRSGHRRPH